MGERREAQGVRAGSSLTDHQVKAHAFRCASPNCRVFLCKEKRFILFGTGCKELLLLLPVLATASQAQQREMHRRTDKRTDSQAQCADSN